MINYNSFVYCLGCKERGGTLKKGGSLNFMLPKRGGLIEDLFQFFFRILFCSHGGGGVQLTVQYNLKELPNHHPPSNNAPLGV